MREQSLLAICTRETLQPDLPLGHLDEGMEMVAHDAVGDEADAAEIGHAPEHTTESLLFDVIQEDLAAAGAGHDVVGVRLLGLG